MDKELYEILDWQVKYSRETFKKKCKRRLKNYNVVIKKLKKGEARFRVKIQPYSEDNSKRVIVNGVGKLTDILKRAETTFNSIFNGNGRYDLPKHYSVFLCEKDLRIKIPNIFYHEFIEKKQSP
jgi:hypothetical protein